MVVNNDELHRRTSLSSSLRRLRNRNGTTSTANLDLIQNDYAQDQVVDDVGIDNPISIICDVDKDISSAYYICEQNASCEAEGIKTTHLSQIKSAQDDIRTPITNLEKLHTAGEDDHDDDVKRKSKCSSSSFPLKRTFGSLHCFAMLLGVMVSFGSLFSVRNIVVNAGGLVPAIFVWISAGAMMFVGAQCYAELATSVRKSGGDFIFLFHALPNTMPSFMQVWMGLVLGSGASISVLGRMGGVHLLKLVCPKCLDLDKSQLPINLVAALIICLFVAVHCRSSLAAARVQVVLTAIKLFTFCFVIILGFIHLATGWKSNLQENAWYVPPTGDLNPMISFAVASMSYSGWQTVAFMTEEVKKPDKTIPFVTSLSVIIAILLCIGLNIAYGTLLTQEELLSNQPIIMLVGYKVLGSWARLVHLPIAVCALSDLNVVIFTVSRMFFSAGREGQSPQLWSAVSVRHNSPTPAILIMAPIALSLLFVDVSPILATFGPFQWLTSAIVVLSLPIYRIRYPHLRRPFKVPMLFPVIYILYCIFLTGLAIKKDARVLGILLATLVPAFPLNILLIRLKRPRCFLRLVGHVTSFLQKLLLVAPPDEPEDVIKF